MLILNHNIMFHHKQSHKIEQNLTAPAPIYLSLWYHCKDIQRSQTQQWQWKGQLYQYPPPFSWIHACLKDAFSSGFHYIYYSNLTAGLFCATVRYPEEQGVRKMMRRITAWAGLTESINRDALIFIGQLLINLKPLAYQQGRYNKLREGTELYNVCCIQHFSLVKIIK